MVQYFSNNLFPIVLLAFFVLCRYVAVWLSQLYCCHNCDASFTYCFVTCVSTWVSTCFILRDAKSMTLFPRAQVQYVWIALWCISTAKPHSLATLRITEEVSEVADINCYCCAQECWGTILQMLTVRSAGKDLRVVFSDNLIFIYKYFWGPTPQGMHTEGNLLSLTIQQRS